MATPLSGLRVHHLKEAVVKYDGTTTLADALAAETSERDAAFAYPCPKCGGQGQYSGVKDGLGDEMVTCEVCDGQGKTAIQKVARVCGYDDVVS